MQEMLIAQNKLDVIFIQGIAYVPGVDSILY